jgi:HAD superfamily hydrolase (TIGR01459 family)
LIESPRKTRFLAFAEAFDAVFFDQYGVLHDGRRLYPGVIDALSALKARGARVAILSNSGKSGEANARRLERIGIARDLYDQFVTSGDVARELLVSDASPVATLAAARCLIIRSYGEDTLAEDLGLRETDDPAEADLVVIGGSQADEIPLDDYARRLRQAAERGAPCVCTNPDRWMLTEHGPRPAAGAIAAEYERMGGRVTWIGKPYPAIYERAARLLGCAEPSRVLCVGDSVEHDVVGARRFGAAAALFRTGILEGVDDASVAALFVEHAVVPDLVARGFEA